MTRVVVISDLHCGHRVGLTPPDVDNGGKAHDYRRALWNFYAETIDSLKPIDILVCNGDAIEGKGAKNGGIELIAPDRSAQVEWATKCIAYADARQHFFTYGTGYHTGGEDDWENLVAREFGGDIKSLQFINVNGLVFAFRHCIGSSQSPAGRAGPISRDRLWQLIWSINDERPRPDISVYSHVHYYTMVEDRNGTGFSTPALQGYGTDFGARILGGTVDFGLIKFDVEDKYTWTSSPYRLVHRGALATVATQASAILPQKKSTKRA